MQISLGILSYVLQIYFSRCNLVKNLDRSNKLKKKELLFDFFFSLSELGKMELTYQNSVFIWLFQISKPPPSCETAFNLLIHH